MHHVREFSENSALNRKVFLHHLCISLSDWRPLAEYKRLFVILGQEGQHIGANPYACLRLYTDVPNEV